MSKFLLLFSTFSLLLLFAPFLLTHVLSLRTVLFTLALPCLFLFFTLNFRRFQVDFPFAATIFLCLFVSFKGNLLTLPSSFVLLVLLLVYSSPGFELFRGFIFPLLRFFTVLSILLFFSFFFLYISNSLYYPAVISPSVVFECSRFFNESNTCLLLNDSINLFPDVPGLWVRLFGFASGGVDYWRVHSFFPEPSSTVNYFLYLFPLSCLFCSSFVIPSILLLSVLLTFSFNSILVLFFSLLYYLSFRLFRFRLTGFRFLLLVILFYSFIFFFVPYVDLSSFELDTFTTQADLRFFSHLFRLSIVKYFLLSYLKNPLLGLSGIVNAPVGSLLLFASHGGLLSVLFILASFFRFFSRLNSLLLPSLNARHSFALCCFSVIQLNLLLINDYGALPFSLFISFFFLRLLESGKIKTSSFSSF